MKRMVLACLLLVWPMMSRALAQSHTQSMRQRVGVGGPLFECAAAFSYPGHRVTIKTHLTWDSGDAHFQSPDNSWNYVELNPALDAVVRQQLGAATYVTCDDEYDGDDGAGGDVYFDWTTLIYGITHQRWGTFFGWYYSDPAGTPGTCDPLPQSYYNQQCPIRAEEANCQSGFDGCPFFFGGQGAYWLVKTSGGTGPIEGRFCGVNNPVFIGETGDDILFLGIYVLPVAVIQKDTNPCYGGRVRP